MFKSWQYSLDGWLVQTSIPSTARLILLNSVALFILNPAAISLCSFWEGNVTPPELKSMLGHLFTPAKGMMAALTVVYNQSSAFWVSADMYSSSFMWHLYVSHQMVHFLFISFYIPFISRIIQTHVIKSVIHSILPAPSLQYTVVSVTSMLEIIAVLLQAPRLVSSLYFYTICFVGSLSSTSSSLSQHVFSSLL